MDTARPRNADLLIGRDPERRATLSALDGESTAVLLTGDAGIGKTAIWEATVAARRAAGDHVLLSRTSVAEALLPWVGLTDLLRTVPEPLLASLPEPQRRALDTVRLQTVSADVLDERAVGTALQSTLTTLAQTARVLVAIDDLSYLDNASAAAVAFALRRLDADQPANLLATVRGHDPTLPVLQGLPSERIAVGPLTLGALFELLQARLAIRLVRPLLIQVFDTSGGNPLYALELARALDRREIRAQVGTPLPVPAGLDGLVDARVRGLPPDVADLVATTAATWRLRSADVDEAVIELAVAAGMVVVDDLGGQQVVRAAHPLWSAAAYDSLPGLRRRALHGRLAAAADDPIEHVRHAALAASAPSAALADELDAGVTAAAAAGVPDIAAALAQLAVDHTVDPAPLPRRLDRLADAQLRAGDSSGARQTQLAAVTATAPGPERARRRVRLAEFTTEVTGWSDAEKELRDAVLEAGDDPLILAEALMTLSAVTPDIELGATSAARALALLECLPEPDPALLAGALAQVAGTRFRAGQGLDHDLFARAIEIERRHPFRRLSDRADASYAALLKYADDLAGSERLLLQLRAEADGIGDLSSTSYAIGHLVQIKLWQGRMDEGRAHADAQVAVAVLGELGEQSMRARYNLGQAMAHQGQLEDAEAVLAVILEHPAPGEWMAHRVQATLGFVALSRGDAVTASHHLDRWYEALTAMHFGEPGYSRSHLDHLCALVGSGRFPDADVFLTELEGQATRSGRQSAAAVAGTGRAMLEAHAGRFDEARATIAIALAWYDTSPLRFDRARTLLIAGQIHRRARAKTDARRLLVEAEAEFAAFGATAWRALAAAELARVNIRPGAPSQLTETERLVAELAASGLTNREVADRTFLAIKTVEANLARAYRKLGIRSRAELGARMGTTAP